MPQIKKPSNAIEGTEIVINIAQDGTVRKVCLIPGDEAWPGSTRWSPAWEENLQEQIDKVNKLALEIRQIDAPD